MNKTDLELLIQVRFDILPFLNCCKIKIRKRGTLIPPDDEPSGYAYKVRSSGLADFSRLRMNSMDVNVHAGNNRKLFFGEGQCQHLIAKKS